MALKFGADLGPMVGTTAPGVETTDLSCGRETWEERCSGAPGLAIAINTSLNEAGVVTLACISDSSMAPLGMGPTRRGGRLEEGHVGEEGPAMGRARSATVAEGATTAGGRGERDLASRSEGSCPWMYMVLSLFFASFSAENLAGNAETNQAL
jgi:hypothetical protein